MYALGFRGTRWEGAASASRAKAVDKEMFGSKV